MQRLYDFLRRHPTGVDVLCAVVLLGLGGIWLMGTRDVGDGEPPWAAVPIMVAMSLVVALRRRAPEKMLILAGATGVAQLICDVEVMPADSAMPVIIYTVSVNGSVWASRTALVAGLCAAPIAQVRWPQPEVSLGEQVFIAVILAAPFGFAWVLGDWLRIRRAYLAELEERAARLENERAVQSRMAVQAEHARIARELHNVVTHNVLVMVVQADGAAYVLDTAPEQARKALETISGAGRQALTEMRRLLDVLRNGECQEGGEYVPQPDVRQIEDLVGQVRDAGLPIEFKVEGAPRPLPSGVELTAYRIVQEALTNTRKHGGPDAGASVRLVYFNDGLGLLIADDGRGAAQRTYGDGGFGGSGLGLIGMRERVGMVGGTLDVGPRQGGGFLISVLLPLDPAR
ncbi:sensor histidine kinase [Streptomyces sp. NPDC001700]